MHEQAYQQHCMFIVQAGQFNHVQAGQLNHVYLIVDKRKPCLMIFFIYVYIYIYIYLTNR